MQSRLSLLYYSNQYNDNSETKNRLYDRCILKGGSEEDIMLRGLIFLTAYCIFIGSWALFVHQNNMDKRPIIIGYAELKKPGTQ
jgi:hypothetical protein